MAGVRIIVLRIQREYRDLQAGIELGRRGQRRGRRGSRRTRWRGRVRPLRVSVTWGLFRAGSGAWATKICALRRSSVPVFFLSSPSHATRFIQPMVLSSRSFVCFGDILTHSLMPRDMAFLAFVSFTGDVED